MNKEFEKILKMLEERTSFLSDCMKYGNKDAEQQNKSYSTMMMYEVADLVDDLIEIVKQETEQYNNGWIPCSERLPEPIRPVLVTLRNWMNDKYFVRVGRFHTDHWKTDEGIVENSVVIAWQPLPEPFKERD